ncbi:MAG: DUF2169 domain-containing protein [Planctomycetota bacterium]
MDLLDESGLAPGWLVTFVSERRLCASFALKGTFLLKHQGIAELSPKQDDLEGDVPEQEGSTALAYTRDLTPLKARVDLLLSGVAFAPGGIPTDILPVTFKLGGWGKTLAVLGDRFLTRGFFASTLTPASTFTEMPLSWGRALGGVEFALNPAGRGLDEERDARRKPIYRQPNVVQVNEAGYGSFDLKEPAGFGPLAPEWPQRAKLAKQARYGSKWLSDTWPAPPRDFDLGYFNAAPPDQQVLAGTLRGDEAIDFVNLHPSHPRFESRLPGIRPRLFVLESGTGDDQTREPFREVSLQIDTLWVDPAKEKLILVWRGLHPVRSKGMKEISAIVIGREPMDHPALPAQYYLDRLVQKRKERADRQNAPAPPPPQFVPLVVEKPNFDWAAWEKEIDKEEQDMLQEMDAAKRQTTEETKGAAARALQAEGISPSILDITHPQDPESLAAQAAKDHAALVALSPEAAKLMPPPPTAAELDVDAMVKAAFDDFDREFAKPVLPESGPDAPPPPPPDLDPARTAWTRERVESHAARKEPFVRLDLRELDLSGIVLREARFEDCVLAKSKLGAADLAGASFHRCSLAESNLSQANLATTALRFCDLTKSDFSQAVLSKTVLDDSDCSGALFEQTSLEEVSACRASFTKATFKGTIFRSCNFTQAQFSGASLEELSLGKSMLKGVNAYEVKAVGAGFEECDLTNFRTGDGADFSGAVFERARAPASVWEGVCLDRASFIDADLTRASFASASLRESKFGRANLWKARLIEADLTQADLQRVNLFRGSLEGANLTRADFRGANLYEVEFLDSIREQTDFLAANLKGTKLG